MNSLNQLIKRLLIKNSLRLTICFLALFTQGCSNLTEEITINADGSGEYKAYTDMIPGMREMSMKMMTMFSQMDTTQTINMDSLKMVVEAKVWEEFPNEVDSLIDFSSQIPDSIKNNPEYAPFVKKAQGYMQGGKEKGYLNMGVRYPFDNFTDLGAFHKFTDKNKSVAGGGRQANALSPLADMKTEVSYSWVKNKITRTTKVIDRPEIDHETMAMLLMMIPKDAKVKTIIHLPKPVKSATGDNLSKAEGKMVIFEHPLIGLFSGEANTDFEIIMKR